MADREEEPPASPASAAAAVAAPSTYPLILRIMSKRRTWACLFVLVYAVLLSSTWNSLKSILAWYQSQANQHPSSGWPALYASVLLGAVFGVLSMVAALAVAIPATLVTWITVVVLLGLLREAQEDAGPRREQDDEGDRWDGGQGSAQGRECRGRGLCCCWVLRPRQEER
ncbi:hypothetical protein EUGRSUZ_A01824 [Eucalyptus grandis]|uniref:Uncharacterized protein n=2 Tax=Eucalyptus grandis TaxID=71139 RepID=A0ACC3M5R3_EUCGR|nr:hypothetical protein EUGRSUZ_A01824 [Eucalyptus grandis]